MSGYRTIVADPPWKYTKTPQRTEPGRGAPAEAYYPTLTIPEIAALPIGALADDEAHLYLWVTNPVLLRTPSPLDVVHAWGFKPQTVITWVKTGAPGLGFYFRGMTEHVIFATRGGLGIPAGDRVHNVFTCARAGHSQKPEAFQDLVERVSPGPYLELFARRQRMGWDVWGNEVDSHVEMVS